MGENKKYKYNITFYKGVLDNIANKLTDYNVSYNPEDIFKAIDTYYSDMNMINTYKVNDTSNEEQTKIIQNDLNKKEKERLDNIKSLTKEEQDKLYEENEKMSEMIKKIEHEEIKEWMLANNVKEDEITEESIEKNRDYYFSGLYNDDYVYREYNKDGTYTLVRDNQQAASDKKEELQQNPSSKSGSSNITQFDYEITFKLSEYTPISGSKTELDKIPSLFLNKRSLLILKNNDNKCFLYCYIREILNPITRNSFRITKKDKELANEIINETNLSFDNVSIGEINKIEKKLNVYINIFSCNKKYKNKNPIRKSRENYDKILDLLLIENINHYIIIKNLHCLLTDRCSEKDNYICRTCLNIFYSKNKYDEHVNYCENRKPQRLMPKKDKYIKFNKLQNCMLNNFIIYSDFECIIDKNNEHKFISGGYLVKYRNDEFTKPVQIFDNLDDYCENLKNELDYIEKINTKYLNYKIDMKSFNQTNFDNTEQCEYCDYKFYKKYDDRIIELHE